MNELLAAIFAPIMATITGLFKIISKVREGEQGLVLRLGKVRHGKDGKIMVREPGKLIFLWPFIDVLHKKYVRQKTIHFERQKIMVSNGIIFDVRAMMLFRIIDIYKALFNVENLEKAVEDLCRGVLRDVISQKSHQTIKTLDVTKELLEAVQTRASEWGVEFLEFKITECAPTPEMAHLTAIEIGADLRFNVLLKMATLGDGRGNFDRLKGVDPNLATAIVGTPLVATLGEKK